MHVPRFIDKCLGCFHVLAVMTEAATNILEQVFLWMNVFISCGLITRSGTGGSQGKGCLIYIRTNKLFSKVGVPFYIPTGNVRHFVLFYIFTSIWLSMLFTSEMLFS